MSLPPLDVPALLKTYGLRPDKSLGQNFLLDPKALKKVVEVSGIMAEDHVLEIGPGLGSLTRYLAMAAQQVTAVEIDDKLIPLLRQVMEAFDNVSIIHGDILEQNPAVLMNAPGYHVVANIPYYITSAIIRHLLEAPLQPSRIVLTIQKEVADRICALPGDMSLLALSVQVYGKPQIVAKIPAGAFYPAPKVDSAVVRVDLYAQPAIPKDQLPMFFRLIKAGFSQKRKTLRNSLSAGMGQTAALIEAQLAQAQIDPTRRAETLNLEEWRTLTQVARQTAT